MQHFESRSAARKRHEEPCQVGSRFLSALTLLATLALLLAACGREPSSRSRHSFAEISREVSGKTAAEVVASLGEPDSKQRIFLGDERWIWWNFTFLDGNDIPPETRGQVVHLRIRFRNPTRLWVDPPPYSQWPIAEPRGVDYLLTGEEP